MNRFHIAIAVLLLQIYIDSDTKAPTPKSFLLGFWLRQALRTIEALTVYLSALPQVAWSS